MQLFRMERLVVLLGLCLLRVAAQSTTGAIVGTVTDPSGRSIAGATVTATNESALATYLSMWGLFTAVMFLGTLRLNRALQFVFGSLTILFALLAIGDFTNASAGFKHFTGYEGLVCGFAAIYTGLAQVLNELYGRTVLPLGMVKK